MWHSIFAKRGGMSKVEEAAKALRAVYAGAQPIAPLRGMFDDPSVETAYAVQDVNTRIWVEEGRRITGRKIGLTSRAVQRQLGVDQPDYGILFQDMESENGGETAASSICQPRIEGEIAFVLGTDIQSEEPSLQDIQNAIEYAVAAFEIVGSRIRNWDIGIFDTIADNASSGKYVLGDQRAMLDTLDLLNCQMTLEANGEVVSSGQGSACLGNPLLATQWLARVMATAGRPLKAGDLVLSGALGPFVGVEAGQTYDLKIDGLGAVRTSFV